MQTSYLTREVYGQGERHDIGAAVHSPLNSS